jgi:hypothetical protein
MPTELADGYYWARYLSIYPEQRYVHDWEIVHVRGGWVSECGSDVMNEIKSYDFGPDPVPITRTEASALCPPK